MRIVRILYQRSYLTLPLILTTLLALGILMACGGASGPEPASTSPPPTAIATEPVGEPDPTPTPARIDDSTRNWNVLGSPDALVTVLDYSDFQ